MAPAIVYLMALMLSTLQLDRKLRLPVSARNLFRHYVVFTKAAPFIAGLVFSLSFVEYTLVGVLMNRLINDWDQDSPTAASIVNAREAFTAALLIPVAYVSDTYLGRFRAVLCLYAVYTTALVLIWLSALEPDSDHIWRLYVALAFIALGKAGKVPFKAFIADQLRKLEDTPVKEERVEDRRTVWWGLPWLIGAIVTTFWTAYWKKYVALSTILVAVALPWFWSGKPFGVYEYTPPVKTSPLSRVYHVVKAAISKRHLPYPQSADEFLENLKHHIPLSPDHPCFRWLDKAAIIDHQSNINSFQEQESERKLISVGDVEEVKFLLMRMVPMWSTLLIYGLVIASGSTFFLDQASSINYHFPVEIFLVIQIITRFIASRLWRNRPDKTLVKIGLGMLCAVLCCAVAYVVRVYSMHHHQQMSVFWLTPQFIFQGLMEGFAEDGIESFFAENVSESIRMYAPPIQQCVTGLGKFLAILLILHFRSWFTTSDDLETTRLDNYYRLLAILSLGNLILYGFVMRICISDENSGNAEISWGDIEAATPEVSLVTIAISSPPGEKAPLLLKSFTFSGRTMEIVAAANLRTTSFPPSRD